MDLFIEILNTYIFINFIVFYTECPTVFVLIFIYETICFVLWQVQKNVYEFIVPVVL